jgi:protein transport protein SEC61 subunit beta
MCRRRRADSENNAVQSTSRAGSTAGIMKMYSLDDTPGIKVYPMFAYLTQIDYCSDPIVVLVLSLIFIGSVLLLHIWARFMRG